MSDNIFNKTKVVNLIGEPEANLEQLGIQERESFLKLEAHVLKLLSTNPIIRYGHDIVSRAKILLRKKEKSFFDQCIDAYSRGLGIESARYHNFISLFDLAAHYGQVYPELKSLIPGCMSVFQKEGLNISHSRLLDFPLMTMFNLKPRLYYWQFPNKKNILSYSTEGLAPLMFHGVHESGMSFALHHKPSEHYFKDGSSIFEIIFESLFKIKNYQELKKEIKKSNSITKWGILYLDKSGEASLLDIDGPTIHFETFTVNETNPLVFTNIPLVKESKGYESFIRFSLERQLWMKNKLSKKNKNHILDLMCDVADQNETKWIHPASTLSTVGACHINLTKGSFAFKESNAAIVKSDPIYELSLDRNGVIKEIKPQESISDFELAWKKASMAQSYFDQALLNEAYHEIQMSCALMPLSTWKNILVFYQSIWDFKFIANNRELALVYKRVKELQLPSHLNDQWKLLIMRMEKKLNLTPTVKKEEVSEGLQELFGQEKLANTLVFSNWMKLLYPRIEILDVFSPHQN